MPIYARTLLFLLRYLTDVGLTLFGILFALLTLGPLIGDSLLLVVLFWVFVALAAIRHFLEMGELRSQIQGLGKQL